MRFPRSAGILLHISSLPGPCGIGDLGEEALRFVDFLAAAGQSYWQILPLGPTEQSPYVAQSSWAGSPLLISLEELARQGDLLSSEVDSVRIAPSGQVDFDRVRASRSALLHQAAERFFARAKEEEQSRFERFCRTEASWLEDWVLFAAVKKELGGAPWWEWPKGIALRTAQGLKEARRSLELQLSRERYIQFRFFEQWARLREKAAAAQIRFIGDLPIYCARDSADVWAARECFQLTADGGPKAVSGVPPDYFSKDGQLWGTPVYDWKRCRAQGFKWWISRLRGALRCADVVRIDHFRAFDSYWRVPAGASTAKEGKWVKGPGDLFFAAVRRVLGEAPFIAEDLGLITRGVRELRERWELPGMRVLQFAFGEGAASPHLPIRYPRSSVVYTGTHDNNTTVGWYEKASEVERDTFRRYTATDGSSCHYHMVRMAYSSVADLAIIPMQDVLGLGSWARMNTPGLTDGTWRFKLVPGQASGQAAKMLREMAELFGRLPGQKEATEAEAVAA
jgi:4-alpha-glucanotransferase